ncbi:trimeric intracellular cation channel family protein [Microlunatus sp. Y2014]|uniref:trimeric intracellular cation channel family protein n=1 Tax=Microlunatus sp. Y2014 TaxID=3418488 RepID=UPI003DA70B4E
MDDDLVTLFRAIDLTGVFANAVLGGVIARREKLDAVGFVTLAVLSGLGGGVLRDTLLQAGTPLALTDAAYLATALAAALVAFLLRIEGRVWDKVWPVLDAVALGCWAVAGAQKTLAVGLGWVPAILLGMITAVGGGAIRDIVLRRVPTVLGGNTLYATCAAVAAAVLVVAHALGQPSVGMVAGLLVGAGLCLLARWRGWILPPADQWSATQVIPRRYRRAGRGVARRIGRARRRPAGPRTPGRTNPDDHSPDDHEGSR